MPKFSVPVIIETTNIYEVEARTSWDAAAKVGALEAAKTPPTHSHETKRVLGKPMLTVEGEKLTKIAGANEHVAEPTAKDPRRS